MADATNNSESVPRLGPVSYVVLGFLLKHPDGMTSYDLKAKVEQSVGYFWPFPHTQLYTEPRRLAEAGLLDEEVEAEGRRRRIYRITKTGRHAMTAWLDQPVTEQTEIRDLGLLQFFFAGNDGADPDRVRERVRALARAQIVAHEQRMREYAAIGEAIASGMFEHVGMAGDGLSDRTLAVGTAVEEAMLAFWRAAELDPPHSC